MSREHRTPMGGFDGRRLVINGKRQLAVRHAGDVGDVILSLPAVKYLCDLDGCSATVYLEAANYTRSRLTPDNWRGIDRILLAQPYVSEVHPWNGGAVDINLNDFRSRMFRDVHRGLNRDRHISDWVALAHKLPETIKDEPWLTIEPVRAATVVVNRTGPGRYPGHVYHGQNFPWGQAVKKYSKDAVFVGTELEHEVFQAQFGDIAWHKTPSLYEVAQVIAGAKLFIGNQSAPHAIAQGLGVATVLEVWHAGANCSGWRPNQINGMDHKTELPNI